MHRHSLQLVLLLLSCQALLQGWAFAPRRVSSGGGLLFAKRGKGKNAAGEDLTPEQSAKIKAEIASPFRLVRQFIYGGAGAAGALGTFTAVPQLIFALQDGGDAVTPAITNIGIDLAAVIGAVLLWDRESAIGRKKEERYLERELRSSSRLTDTAAREREAELAKLPIEILFSSSDENSTRIVSFADLQAKGNQNVIVVAGTLTFIKDSILSARVAGKDLFNNNNVYIIPVVLSSESGQRREDSVLAEQLAETESSGNKGFGSVLKESLLGQTYIGRPTQVTAWARYMEKEVRAAEQQGQKDIVKQGLVLAIDKSGKVIRRGVGVPPWEQIVTEVTNSSAKKG